VQRESTAQQVATALRRLILSGALEPGTYLSRGQLAVQTAITQLDGLDIVVNCAGVSRPRALLELTPSLWQETIDINLSGAFYVGRDTGGYMGGHGGRHDRQRRVGAVDPRPAVLRCVLRIQGRRTRPNKSDGRRTRPGCHRHRGMPGCREHSDAKKPNSTVSPNQRLRAGRRSIGSRWGELECPRRWQRQFFS
jgi:NAD(P)-dependent dehydrogenase (short-subunit alcohol dehydrogenase family)